MLSRGLNFALRLAPRSSTFQITARNTYSTSTGEVYERDPAPYFFDEEIQSLLKSIVHPDPEKVFRRRLDGRHLRAPRYKFMTDNELQKAQEESNNQMWELLQMPPIVKIRVENDRLLAKNPEVQGFDKNPKTKLVFTDISFGLNNKNRMIVVREPNGNLRFAKNAERDRLNQIYFPIRDRDIRMPKMFEDEYLQTILERGDYEFILNRACAQFEPDNEDYHRVCHQTYEYVNTNMQYAKLRSTRHFGNLVFYLAWTKNLDNLVLENITTNKIEDATVAIKLYYKLHPSEEAPREEDPVKLIQHFIETKASSKRKLDQALKTYLELKSEEKKIQQNIEKAHGKTNSSDEEIQT